MKIHNRLLTGGALALLLAIAPAMSPAHGQQAGARGARPATGTDLQALEGVAAVVNDQPISFTDVRHRAQLILLSLGVQTTEETRQQAQQRAIESLVEEQLQLQEAKTHDLVISDEEIDRALANIARQNGVTLEAFLGDLTQRGINPRTLRDQMRADLAWRQLVGGRFSSRVRISSLQIDDMLARMKGAMNQPQYNLAEIFLATPTPEARAEALEGAAILRTQILERGAPFELVAKQFSAAASASAGGDLGWLPESDIRDELRETAKSLTPPAVSQPIETEEGVYLIAVMGKREAADEGSARLRLKQLAARGEGAAVKVLAAKAKAASCSDTEKAAGDVEGVTSVNLGEVQLSALSETFRNALANVPAGGSTDPLDISNGKAVLFVCERVSALDQNLLSRDQIEDRLFEQQISMMADRYLRDLKREATIIRR